MTQANETGRSEMNLTTRRVSGAVIIDVRGKLDGGFEDCATFRTLIRTSLADGDRQVVINLADAPWANSVAIGMMVGAYTSVKNAGGELVLACVPDRIHHVLSVTRLTRVLRTLPSEGEALAHLARRLGLPPDTRLAATP
jgi:anti-sigma B factor antagonist